MALCRKVFVSWSSSAAPIWPIPAVAGDRDHRRYNVTILVYPLIGCIRSEDFESQPQDADSDFEGRSENAMLFVHRVNRYMDNDEANQLEVNVTGGALRQLSADATLWTSGVEAEYRVNRKFGVALEATFGGHAPATRSNFAAEVVVAASWALYQNFARELHLQLQVYGRLYTNGSITRVAGFNLGDPTAPFAVRLHGAWRRRVLNLRWGVGLGGGSEIPYSPLLANVAVLWEWGAPILHDARRGYIGVEVDVDGARANPLFVIPEVAVHVALTPRGPPIRIGVALPIQLGTTSHAAAVGGLLRVVVEAEGRD